MGHKHRRDQRYERDCWSGDQHPPGRRVPADDERRLRRFKLVDWLLRRVGQFGVERGYACVSTRNSPLPSVP